MKKRGSHVGMVLSFVIFITFLVFLYSIIEPAVKTQGDKQALLDYLKRELIQNFSAEMASVTITVEKTIPQNCIELENLVTELDIISTVIVKGETENILSNQISGNNLQIDREGIGDFFFKIYQAEEFEELGGGTFSSCKLLKYGESKKEYTIGLTRTDEYIFETKIIRLIDEYENNYEDLKDELKIPLGSEFGFSFRYDNETIIGTEEKNVSINIYSEEIPTQYIDGEANILPGFITVKVW